MHALLNLLQFVPKTAEELGASGGKDEDAPCAYSAMLFPADFIAQTNLLFQILISEVPDFLCSKTRPKLQRNHWHTLFNASEEKDR